MPFDNWDKDLNTYYRCELCSRYTNFRCKRNAPTRDGFPMVYPTDSACGNFKMDKGTMQAILDVRNKKK